MRIAVVGNGPSANGKGEFIDGHDFVVRMNRYKQAFPGSEAGKKLSAFAWSAFPKWNRLLPSGSNFEMWVTCPGEWHKGQLRISNARTLCRKRKLKLRIIPLQYYMTIRHALERLSSKKKLFPPTTGILAVAMALRMNPDELTIVGFDATLPGKPGWHYASKTLPWTIGPGHDFSAEKHMLDILEIRSRWCGAPTDATVRRIRL